MTDKMQEWPKAQFVEELPEGKQLKEIPQPPEHLFGYLGNLPDIEQGFQLRSFWRMADIYGPIYYLNAVNRKIVIVSNYEYAHQLKDDDTTEKYTEGPLKLLRKLMGDGLFTAENDSVNWAKAHRLLVPTFGPLGVKKMFSGMLDIASQMILKWDRAGPENIIMCSDDFTSYRFNQFYAENVHEFARRMADSLIESGKVANRTSIENRLRMWSAAKLDDDSKWMHQLCEDIVDDRIQHPDPDAKDLLNVMLEAKDPVTGDKMERENIKWNMATFLIAGHETTSGTLSFLFYFLLKNPETLQRAQQEVDEVLGDDAITVNHLPKLKYIFACIKETLRLNGPIGGVYRRPKKDLVISGKYRINTDTSVLLNGRGVHRDPKIWGDDAQSFKPERFLDRDYPQDAYNPFGVGVRSCIGRYFAEQEMILSTALILQRFQVQMADPTYNLVMKATLTIKPDNFAIKVRRRPGKSSMVGLTGVTGAGTQAQQGASTTKDVAIVKSKPKIVVAYGSNAGTCKTLAEDLQATAPEHGFEAEVRSLDEITENIPENTPTLLVTSSYEGNPTDDAKKFVSWLNACANKNVSLDKALFAVFGVGNTEWMSTYQKVPKDIRKIFLKQGAKEICEPLYSDVKFNTTGDWEKWTDSLWIALKALGNAGPPENTVSIKVDIIKYNAPALLSDGKGGEDRSWGIVQSVKSLGGQQVGPEKREINIQLPEGVNYRSGDYISVTPFNHPDMVQRVLARFELHPDDMIVVSNTRKAFLKTSNQPIVATRLFGQRVELGMTATQKQIEVMASFASDDTERAALSKLATTESYTTNVVSKCYTVLDILDDHPSIGLPLSAYLDMLKPLAPRQYSISSSPLDSASAPSGGHGPIASLTYDVQEGPSRSKESRKFHGAASTYMARLHAGSQIQCAVRATNVAFHLPADPLTPVVFIAAGTGLAPMRGFIQERVAIAAARGANAIGPAFLYFGCRDYEHDNLYKDELDAADKAGVIKVRRTFSKRPAPSNDADAASSFKYIHERIWADRDELAALFGQGAKFFVCGSAARLAKSTSKALKDIYRERNQDKTEQDAEQWLTSVKQTRYVTDVYD